jgi:hypothetical protein
MKIEDRVIELRRIRAGDLIDNPLNWREHPPEQIEALETVIGTIGFADVALGIDTDAGVMLIDGHARKNLDEDFEVPTVILDLTLEEAEVLLATLDPLAGMANTDPAALGPLIERISGDDPALDALLRSIADEVDLEDHLPEEPTNPKPPTTKIEATRVCPECGYEWND